MTKFSKNNNISQIHLQVLLLRLAMKDLLLVVGQEYQDAVDGKNENRRPKEGNNAMKWYKTIIEEAEEDYLKMPKLIGLQIMTEIWLD